MVILILSAAIPVVVTTSSDPNFKQLVITCELHLY